MLPAGVLLRARRRIGLIVAAHQGIDTGSYSFRYIAAWAGRQDGSTLIKQVLGRVQPIAHRLIEGITPAADELPREGTQLAA